MHPTTRDTAREALVTSMTERMASLTRSLATWMLDAPHTLAELEQQLLPMIQTLGAALLAGVASMVSTLQPARSVACPCGRAARLQRCRPATVITLLGPLTITRPYYHCAACGQGQAPADTHLEICAGSRSAGLDEVLALLGATQDSFAEAAHVLERLTFVQLSPTTVREATETLGAALVAQQAQHLQQLQDGGPAPTPTAVPPPRLYVLMDGVLAHLHERGWREVKVGCCYQTCTRPDRQRPDQLTIHAEQLSYVAALCEAETFGWHLWNEAARRGVQQAAEVVVLGDGAHWIWNIATTLFPQATQVLDWYHASSYVWEAASAIWGLEHPERERWVHAQLDALWAGEVQQVLAELAAQQEAGAAVEQAISSYTTHQGRMDYPSYRARGVQIGSGSVESACKQVVSTRLKGAGMIWTAAGAEQVAVVRAWLKRGRWAEAMALRPLRQRGYGRRSPQAPVAARLAPDQQAEPVDERVSSAEGIARVQAELAREQAQHPWKRAWSHRQQRREAEARDPATVTSTA